MNTWTNTLTIVVAMCVLPVSLAPAMTISESGPGSIRTFIPHPSPVADIMFNGEEFGFALDVYQGLALIGAPADDTAARDSGRAFIADLATGQIVHTFLNPTPEMFGNFGNSVAFIGNHIVIAASRANDSSISDSGAVFVYDAMTKNLQATLLSDMPQPFGEFGFNVTSIGSDRVVVSEIQRRNEEQTLGGKVLIYDLTDFSLVSKIVNPRPQDVVGFGWAAAAYSKGLIVTSPFDGSAATDAGIAYLFDPMTNEVLHTFVEPEPGSFDRFGVSVAASEKYIVFGSEETVPQQGKLGAVYVYDATTYEFLYTIDNPEPDNGDEFGWDVAIEGDQLLVGAFRDRTSGAWGGAVHLYDLRTGTRQLSVGTPTPMGDRSVFRDDFFGYAVDLWRGNLVVGAPLEENGLFQSGGVYVFRGVPEPASILLLAGLAVSVGLHRRRMR